METNKLKIKSQFDNMKKVFNDPILFATIIAVLIAVTMFIVFPLVNILKKSFFL